ASPRARAAGAGAAVPRATAGGAAGRRPPTMPTTFARFPSPLGELVLTASETALTGVYLPTSRHVPPLHVVERGPGGKDDDGESGTGADVLALARQQLSEYFARPRAHDVRTGPRPAGDRFPAPGVG